MYSYLRIVKTTYNLVERELFLPGTQVSGAHTALLALILCAYLIISSEEIAPRRVKRRVLTFQSTNIQVCKCICHS